MADTIDQGVQQPEGNTGAGVDPTPQPQGDQTFQQEAGQAHTDQDFPEEQDKQRQAFIAMRKKIDDLERKNREYEDSVDLLNLARGVPDENTQPNYPTQQAPRYNPQSQQFDTNDPATNAFVTEAQQARQSAEYARQAALRAQAQLEDFEAWQKYPNLNPKSTDHDRDFRDDVQKEYLAQRLRSQSLGKKPPALVDVADAVQKRYERIRGQAVERANAQAQVTNAQKAAATLESRGTSLPVQSQISADEESTLRAKVNRGDTHALAELLKRTDPYYSME
jgi:hypothetical protein